MRNALVSVIVPNYNHAIFLSERIESILCQTYKDIELIILDDCSTDDSRQVIEFYRSNKAVSHIIYNQENSGSTFKQWDKGISLAKGEWIWIAESDDWCEPTLLQTLVETVTEKTCISYCQSIVCFSNGDIYAPARTHRYEKEIFGPNFVKEEMLFELPIYNASMSIFKRDCYYKIDKVFTTYKFCGDWLFWILIAHHGNVNISCKYLNYFRKHDKDVSGKAYKNGLFYTEYINIIDYLSDNKVVLLKDKQKLMMKKYNKFIDDSQLNPDLVFGLRKSLIIEMGNVLYSYDSFRNLGIKKYLSAILFKLINCSTK